MSSISDLSSIFLELIPCESFFLAEECHPKDQASFTEVRYDHMHCHTKSDLMAVSETRSPVKICDSTLNFTATSASVINFQQRLPAFAYMPRPGQSNLGKFIILIIGIGAIMAYKRTAMLDALAHEVRYPLPSTYAKMHADTVRRNQNGCRPTA